MSSFQESEWLSWPDHASVCWFDGADILASKGSTTGIVKRGYTENNK